MTRVEENKLLLILPLQLLHECSLPTNDTESSSDLYLCINVYLCSHNALYLRIMFCISGIEGGDLKSVQLKVRINLQI